MRHQISSSAFPSTVHSDADLCYSSQQPNKDWFVQEHIFIQYKSKNLKINLCNLVTFEVFF